MKKMLLYFISVVLILLITGFFIAGADRTNQQNILFLQKFGWKISDQPIECEEILLPEQFDQTYHTYNELQLQIGMDLLPYRGKKCTRYTYLVLNYPKEVDEPVRANIICYRNKPIGGDIMTVSLAGFMHSLNFPIEENELLR